MWSREDEFLSVCMGIGIRGDRGSDYAYLDPLCWKLPDCDFKKAHVWRADSLVFGKNNHSSHLNASSFEVLGII